FWSAYLLWLVAAHRKLDSEGRVPLGYWLLGAILLGGGVLGKYTMALGGMAGFASFMLARNYRAWLPGYILHGVLAIAVASPILIFNIQNDFAPLQYQWKHSMATHAPGFKPFGDFLGVQIVLFGTMPLALFPWVVRNARRLMQDAKARVCLCLYAMPYAFFLYKATRGPLEGNWALACYIAFWPLAAIWYEEYRQKPFWRWSAPAAFLIPAIVSTVGLLHILYPIPGLPAKHDRITRQKVKFEITQQLRDVMLARQEPLPVYCASYQMTALMRFHGVDAMQLEGVTRPSHFTQVPHRLADSERAYLIWEGIPKEGMLHNTDLIEVVASIPLEVQGQPIAYYTLLLYRRSVPVVAESGGQKPD
ncbi:MAG: hypothetical protein ACRCZF_12665, partial [Gemmataceae bacterium]